MNRAIEREIGSLNVLLLWLKNKILIRMFILIFPNAYKVQSGGVTSHLTARVILRRSSTLPLMGVKPTQR